MSEQYPGQVEQLRKDLHNICQPLTVLCCKLELEVLQAGDERHGEVMRELQRETERIRQIVVQMRERVHEPGEDISQQV